MNICMIGFMGSGKTSIGKLVAQRNSMSFADTDAMLVERENRTIADIFRDDGEAYFRDAEHELVVELSGEGGLTNTVLSTGGGLVIAERNQEYLKRVGTVVYLRTSPETIYDRVKDSKNRPLLNTEDKLGRIKEMLEVRGPVYEAAADVIVDTDGLSRKEVAALVERACGIK